MYTTPLLAQTTYYIQILHHSGAARLGANTSCKNTGLRDAILGSYHHFHRPSWKTHRGFERTLKEGGGAGKRLNALLFSESAGCREVRCDQTRC